MGEIDTYKVDILGEDEASELVGKILKVGSIVCTKSEVSLLVAESGRIPVTLCIMARIIVSVNMGGSTYSITKLLQEMKDKSKLLRYPSGPKHNLDLQYKKSLYTCVKIALDKLQESKDVYAPMAIHFIEGCAYFHNECPIDYFLNHVTTFKQDIEQVLIEVFVPLKPMEVLTNAIRLLSRFSLINTTPDKKYEFGIKVEIHRLVQATVRLIQKYKERDLLEELICCKDYPKFKSLDQGGKLKETYFLSHPTAILWSHASNHEDLIRKYFIERGSLSNMIYYGFFNEVRKIVELLGEKESARKILQVEPKDFDSMFLETDWDLP
ncbi:uncharacterized protein LOC118433568 [Folsomia candida]|nr:uncharacterized protein LOC118433568 [Folsomia candida]XP_035701466.1 uncharacterized protein LOC118433568 [Folsomia candida]XP_035701467.1 uncharacterized protein LOC118433568 [Folsomia candida]